MRTTRALFVLALLCAASRARAEGPAPPAPAAAPDAPAPKHADPPKAPEYRVDFRADRVEVEPETFELELEGNVVVKVARYRIESEALSLSRGPRGLEVEGAGEVALCPCEDAPVTLGFQSATVAPPTDVLLEQPTLRVGGVPVFWMPFLWLRARDRLGLLPAWIEWRGDDGVLLGGGAHLPVGGTSTRGRAAAFDLRAGGYFEGGARIDALLDVESSRTRVVWDHLDESALLVASTGAVSVGDGALKTWSIDALRGPRGREYPSSLDMASRRYDRATFSLGHADRGVAGLGLEATASRGGPLDDFGAIGPTLHAGLGGPLGSGSSADAALDVTSLHAPGGDVSAMVGETLFELEAPSGAVALGATLRQRAVAVTRESDAGAALTSGFFPRISLPLQRRYDAFSHLVEPSLSAAQVLRVETDSAISTPPSLPGADTQGDSGETLWVTGAGLANALGSARRAVSLFVAGGLVGGDELEPAAAGELSSDLEVLTVSVIATAQEDRATGIGRARLGRTDTASLGLRAEATTEGGSAPAQWLLPDAWDNPTPLLDEAGVSSGASLRVPFAGSVESEVGGDFDVTSSELLAVYGSLGFNHPCGCLGATAWAGHRTGRGGFDAWVSVDLLP